MPSSVELFDLNGTAASTRTCRLLGKGPFDLRVELTMVPGDGDPYTSLSLETSHDGETWWEIGQTPDTGGIVYTVQPSMTPTLKATYPNLSLMEYVRATVTPSAPLAWTALAVVSSPKPVSVLEVP